jgi:hypothetical protein
MRHDQRQRLRWPAVYIAVCTAAIVQAGEAFARPAVLYAQRGDLIGQVVERHTQQPVGGAGIRMAGLETETDSAGVFRLADVAAGRHRLEVRRLGYGELSIDVDIKADGISRVLLSVDAQAITLSPLTAEVLSHDSMRVRGTGYMRGIATREQLALWEGSALRFADVLRTVFPSIRVRRADNVAGSDVCVELRTIRAMGNQCLYPAVYLDGVPISNPGSLIASLEPRMIESVEVVPAAEAGVRYGTGALFGAMLIETRRPGSGRGRREAEPLQPNFDWSTDPAGHNTGRVLAAATVGNAAGLALGLAAARTCIRLRAPAYDAIVSDCEVLPTIGSGLAAIVLPALGAGIGARLSGQTEASRGQFAPAAVAAAMLALPGYGLSMSGKRNDSEVLQYIGAALLTMAAPAATTLADYLFRHQRD